PPAGAEAARAARRHGARAAHLRHRPGERADGGHHGLRRRTLETPATGWGGGRGRDRASSTFPLSTTRALVVPSDAPTPPPPPPAPPGAAAAGAGPPPVPADAEVLLLGPPWEAADDLARAGAAAAGARFGTTRMTLDRLAARLATPALASTGRAPASGLSLVAVAARAVHRLGAGLPYFAPVAARPGFPPAGARPPARGPAEGGPRAAATHTP